MGTQATNVQCRTRDIIFHIAEAEIGTIPNSRASYHGAALAGVDRRIRLSNDGMMESGKVIEVFVIAETCS